MEHTLPAAALAHLVMKVQNVDASYDFYAGLGLRALDTFPGMAIIELRGGTHLLLFQKGDQESGALLNSHSGQRPEFGSETLDLMIAGHAKAELEQYRAGLVAKGYSPSAIADRPL